MDTVSEVERPVIQPGMAESADRYGRMRWLAGLVPINWNDPHDYNTGVEELEFRLEMREITIQSQNC